MENHTGYVISADIRQKWQQQIKQAEEAIAMYKSPIAFMLTDKQVQMENGVLKALQDVGIIVDKAELLKALAYDREQYQKGYADGREAGHEWISVEDRLPENDVDVLVWFEYFRYGSYNRLFQTYGISYVFNGEWSGFVNGQSGWDQMTIIAWMPLPEPPKGD